jgi:hypothetical protein
MLPALAIAAGIALPIVIASCDKVPLLAPTGTVINLFPTTNTVSLNSQVDIVATAIENGVDVGTGTGTSSSRAGAGTPVQNGTVISFTTTLGRIEPSEARTHNGQVTVKLITATQSGTATITAYSGGASKTISLKVGTAAASHVQLTANPQTLGSAGGTSRISALVTDEGGSPVGGIPVTFSTDQGSLDPTTGTTDNSGVATTTLTTSATATISAAAGGVPAQIIKVNVGAKALSGFVVSSGTAPTVGVPVVFTVTPGANANVQNVHVSFGDGGSQDLGAISAATTVTHVYDSPGTYTATATGTDATGSSTLSTSVVVGAAAVTVAVSGNTVNSPIQFTATVPANTAVDHYTWTFDDGTSFQTSGNQTTHVFATRGTHFAQVDVFGVGGGKIGTAQVAFPVN